MSEILSSEPISGKFPFYAITVYFVLQRCLKELGRNDDEIPAKGWTTPLYNAIVLRQKGLPGLSVFESNQRIRTQYLQKLAAEATRALTDKKQFSVIKIDLILFQPLLRFCGITIDHIQLNALFGQHSSQVYFKTRVQEQQNGEKNEKKLYVSFSLPDEKLRIPEKTNTSRDENKEPAAFLFQYNLPIRPPYFVGRKALLKELNNKLSNERTPIVLLHGVGGMGKTTVMQEYLSTEPCRKHFERVIYAGVTKSLEEAFVRTTSLALSLEDQRKQLLSASKQLEFVTGELSRFQGRNLFVIDNVNEKDYNDLKRLRPYFERAGWSFLITTRTRPDGFAGVDVDELETDEAEALFLYHFLDDEGLAGFKRTPEFDRMLSALLLHVLRHTLMIEMLAKAALKKELSLQDLLQRLKEKDFRHPDLQRTVWVEHGRERLSPAAVHEYLLDLFDTDYLLRVTGNAETDAENAERVTMLRFFSVLPALDIPVNDLEFLWNVSAAEENEFENRLDELKQMGWLLGKRRQVDLNEPTRKMTYKMHQLVQEVVYEKLQPDAENCMRLVIRVNQILGEMPDDPRPYYRYARSIYDKLKALITERPKLKRNERDNT